MRPARRDDELPGAPELPRPPDAPGQLVYFVFDLLYLDGQDLTGATLEARKRRSSGSSAADAPARAPLQRSRRGPGRAFFRQACRLVARGHRLEAPRRALRARARAAAGSRSSASRSRSSSSAASPSPKGRAPGLGALLLGVHDGGAVSSTRARSAPASRRPRHGACAQRLDRLRAAQLAFRRPAARRAGRPLGEAGAGRRGRVHASGPRTGGSAIPSFKGLREDKPAARRRARAAGGDGAGAPQRRTGVRTEADRSRRRWSGRSDGRRRPHHAIRTASSIRTRASRRSRLARYYAAVADHMLPHLRRGRPRSCAVPRASPASASTRSTPATWTPPSLRRVRIREKSEDRASYLVVEDVAGLVASCRWASSRSTRGTLGRPPRGARPPRVRPRPGTGRALAGGASSAARWSARVWRHGAPSFVKTTGGKGLHVVVPHRAPAPDGPRASRSRAAWPRRWCARRPGRSSPRWRRRPGKGKIFVDYFRNQRGATSVAAYSTARAAGRAGLDAGHLGRARPRSRPAATSPSPPWSAASRSSPTIPGRATRH